jgi:diadenosine tetraphosphate (Ap4A) HIT family hydrolase
VASRVFVDHSHPVPSSTINHLRTPLTSTSERGSTSTLTLSLNHILHVSPSGVITRPQIPIPTISFLLCLWCSPLPSGLTTMGSCFSQPAGSSSGSAATPRPSPSTETQPNNHNKGDSLSRRVSRRLKGKSRRDTSSTHPSDYIEMNSNSAAILPSPSTSLSPRILLTSNPSTIAIFDAYPKAKYHFLVLPRYPFPAQNDPETTKSIARLDHLDDLQSVLTKTTREAREQIINQLSETAREVEEMIRDEMVKSEGVEWKIDMGFHAIPSLK